ncbi:MAG TPA: metalloregulator ArsR/SmtB family transcription factor [Acidobacteriaceae bacterium]|jgi:DNA-binding transcriptional ArsR family regulator
MTSDPLSTTFAALADPTRRAILARLASGETTVKELSEPFELTQPAITKHLKVLEHAGLISRSRSAQTRPAKLEPAGLQVAWQWVDEYRRFWEESFDRLDEYLKRLQSTPGPDSKPSGSNAPSRDKEKSNGHRRKH